ncbi:MAG TPA: AI-2E family transporter, partial [Saprospiraceae bacterium]|nr:AI-2E family transporter [Saprospiraceae bacterium]
GCLDSFFSGLKSAAILQYEPTALIPSPEQSHHITLFTLPHKTITPQHHNPTKPQNHKTTLPQNHITTKPKYVYSDMKWNNRYAFIIGVILFVAVVTYLFSDIVTYVLIAWVLAMITQPVYRFLMDKLKLGHRSWGNSVAALLTMVALLAVIVLLALILVPPILMQASNLANVDIYAVIGRLEEPFLAFQQWLGRMGINYEEGLGRQSITDTIQRYFPFARIGDWVSSILGAASSFLFGLFAVAFILFFFLREDRLFINFIIALTPREYESRMESTVLETTQLLRRYFAGILLQITCITLIVFTGLSIFGIKNALLIGFFAALINVIPYLGPLIGAIFGILLTASTYIDLPFYPDLFSLLVKVAVVFAFMQLTDNMLLQPLIFSKSVRAHPLEIFLVILLGGKVGGILGMVLAIPSYIVIRVFARVFLSEFKIVQKIGGGNGKVEG